MAENYLSLLKQRTQQLQESLQELSEEIRELSFKAYPEASWKFLDRLSVTHFMDAILNADVREAVHRSKSTTLDDALSAALEAENWRKLENQRHANTSYIRQAQVQPTPTPTLPTVADVQTLKTDVQNLTQMMGSLLQKQMDAYKESQERKANKKPLVCWQCSEPGHKATFYPVRPSYVPPPHFGHPNQHQGNDQRSHQPPPQWSSPPMGPAPPPHITLHHNSIRSDRQWFLPQSGSGTTAHTLFAWLGM